MSERSVELRFGTVVDIVYSAEDVLRAVVTQLHPPNFSPIHRDEKSGEEWLTAGGSPDAEVKLVDGEEIWSSDRVTAAYILGLERDKQSVDVGYAAYIASAFHEEAALDPIQHSW